MTNEEPIFTGEDKAKVEKPEGDNKPFAVVRISPLKATVWKNEYDDGVSYSTEITRTYVTDRDENGKPTDYEETNSLRVQDLLKAKELCNKVYRELGIKVERWGKN